MESQSFAAFIDELKRCVRKMLVERSQLAAVATTATPPPIWNEALSVFSYLLNLSSEDFKNIRFHTELITGELISTYWAPEPPLVPEEFANSLGFVDLILDLPENYWLSEPPAPGIPRPLGVDYNGLTINRNTVRYQIAVANLYYAGVWESLRQSRQKQFVLEVGGGYGGLAHHVGRILGKQITYIIVDLPEMFLFQAPYLAVNAPESSIYIYDRQTFTPEFILKDLAKFDFALIPNFALKKLEVLQNIALMLNMQSFQEMTPNQIKEYLDFGADRLTYCLYSDNVDRHPHNATDLVSVSALLEEYFNLYPSTHYYNKLYQNSSLRWNRYYKKFLATPKDKPSFTDINLITAQQVNSDGKLRRLHAL